MPGKLIAVVNDDPDFVNMMDQLLTEEGYKTIGFTKGQNTYAMIRRERPDLVLLDIRLEHPESGYVLLEMLRLGPVTKNIPVIICSADAPFLREKEAQLRAMNCEVMAKPFELPDLLGNIEAAIGAPN